MTNNTFFISNASYYDITKTAVIASICPLRMIEKTLVLKNINSINCAETAAVLLSVKLAIKNNIKNGRTNIYNR